MGSDTFHNMYTKRDINKWENCIKAAYKIFKFLKWQGKWVFKSSYKYRAISANEISFDISKN